MADQDRQEEDQVARLGKELRDGDWLSNVRNRSQRRKSAWNLLLPLFGLPFWAAFTASLVWLGQVIHAALHQQPHPVIASGPMSVSDTFIFIASSVAAVAPTMLVTNFCVYRIAPARRAMEAEDRGFSGVDYRSSQRALLKVGLWLLAICLPLILVGAALK
jgi:hypothetical protein